MKIVRSKGQSFTNFSNKTTDNTQKILGRGLKLNSPTQSVGGEITRSLAPTSMADFVASDTELLLRQTISVLDKTVRKPKSDRLRNFHKGAYVDRALLAHELWARLKKHFPEPLVVTSLARLKEIWDAKTHPYSRSPVDVANLNNDKNALTIEDFGDKTLKRKDFEGRWHNVFWIRKPDGTSDHASIAEAIIQHVTENQRKRLNQVTLSRGAQAEVSPYYSTKSPDGLLRRRGLTIAASAQDPRESSNRVRNFENANSLKLAGQSVEDYYLQLSDLAKTIYTDIREKIYAGAETGKSERIDFSEVCGKIIYEHFGQLKETTKRNNLTDEQMRALWDFHNSVRAFYRKLVQSDRFVRANSFESPAEALRLIPTDRNQLKSVMAGQHQNANISGLIRLGKALAHASDLPKQGLPDPGWVNDAFDGRLEVYLTSAGQSEIKRNEAFTRVWRSSVAQSVRTLQAWVQNFEQPNPAKNKHASDQKVDDDPCSKGNPGKIYNHFNASEYRRFAPLLFGMRQIDQKGVGNAPPSSRFAILCPSQANQQKEILWGFLRLTTQIRNRSNHFNLKDRFVQSLEKGVLKFDSRALPTGSTRKSSETHTDALNAFNALLQFDLALYQQEVRDEILKLGVADYLNESQASVLKRELSLFADDSLVITPKFITLLKRAKNLAPYADAPQFVDKFGKLDLDNLSKKTEGPNTCAIGLLRLVYTRGFEAWLATRQFDKEFIAQAVKDVVEPQKQRTHNYATERSIHYVYAHTIAEDLDVEAFKSLNHLFSALMSLAMSDAQVRDTYRAKANDQRDRAERVDQFRLDLFAHLFGRYLKETGLAWVFDLDKTSNNPTPAVRETFSKIETRLWSKNADGTERPVEDWHAQLYAWLYLVPVDEIALLRHQIAKTFILEGKEGKEPVQALTQLDRLMRLYNFVHDAGFNGREHVELLQSPLPFAKDQGNKREALFYEDPALFQRVFSENPPPGVDGKTESKSLPGTRRGLRQIITVGSLPVLKSLFEKHTVTNAEFNALTDDKALDLFAQKNRLHAELIDQSKDKSITADQLAWNAEKYRKLAIECARYNFRVTAARLGEHARLHLLMMRVIGRLKDFTLIWERDRTYLLLGMLYRSFGTKGFKIEGKLNEEFDGYDINLVLERDANQIRTPLWNAETGAALNAEKVIDLLSTNDQQIFKRYFGELTQENPRDIAARELRHAELIAKRKNIPKGKSLQYLVQKSQIRNDFAHYNVINRAQSRANLTYRTNAVRSLLSYDRKLKNAVSKAIADIVFDEGLIIEWALDNDRLKRPTVYPRMETHLAAMTPRKDQDLRFKLPQASVRYTSMVKALFEFDQGGYRQERTETNKKGESEKKCRGALHYPAAAYEHYPASKKILDKFDTYPELPKEN